MKANVKPVKLILGHDYEVGYTFDIKVIVRLIQTTPKGYKFFNMKTSRCWRQPIMYPSKEPNHVGKGETWFFVSESLVVKEVSTINDNNIEKILCAAIHFDDGKKYQFQPINIESGVVFCGYRHSCMFQQIGGTVPERHNFGIYEKAQGFLTNKNRFVERKEALEIAIKANQVDENNLGNPLIGLFSEDLY